VVHIRTKFMKLRRPSQMPESRYAYATPTRELDRTNWFSLLTPLSRRDDRIDVWCA
jgi:hypothetical protein